jgi:hypothetical protein
MFGDDGIALVTDGFFFSTGTFPIRQVTDGYVGSTTASVISVVVQLRSWLRRNIKRIA